MNPNQELINFSKKDWEEITQEIFNSTFQGSAVKRTKFKGFVRNIKFANNKN